MDFLRVVGFLVALLMIVQALRRYRRRSLRLPDTLIMLVLALGLATLSVVPSILDPVLTALGFPPGDARRVIGVLVVSGILTYVLLFRAYAKTDRLEQTLGGYADRVAVREFERQYGFVEQGSEPVKKLGVVVPALNEETSLPKVMGEIAPEVEGMKVEVIVVSDGSVDATERVADEHKALVVRRDLRRGQGAAVRLGYHMALKRGADIVATVDADGQYDPRELPQLVRPLLAGEADVAHGSRMLGDYEKPIFGRSQGVRVFAWLTTRMAGHHITDPASGFRAFTSDALHQLEFRENQFHASEVTVAAAKAGLRVKEVPCTFRERHAGDSKKPPLLRYGWGYLRSLIRTWVG
ncbi:MAG TPA: DUF2304 family protein [Actinomycetota bacterium]